MRSIHFKPSKTNWLERLIFFGLFCIFSLSLYWNPISYNKIDTRAFQLPDLSLFHRLGIHGPACGLTRSFVNISHGHFFDGFLANFTGPLVFIVFLVAFFYLAYRFFGGQNKLKFNLSLSSEKKLIFGTLAIFLTNWIAKFLIPI